MKNAIIHVRADENSKRMLREIAEKYKVSESEVILNALVLLKEEMAHSEQTSLILGVIKRLQHLDKAKNNLIMNPPIKL